MAYEARDLRKTFVLDGSEEALTVDDVRIDDTDIQIDWSFDSFIVNSTDINLALSGPTSDSLDQLAFDGDSYTWIVDAGFFEDGDEFTITANISAPDDLRQADQYKFDVVETDDSGSGSDGGLSLGDIDATCDIETPTINENEAAEVDVNIDGTSPDTNTYYVDITLLVNGDDVARGTGRLTANGASGESFEVNNLPVGDNEIDFELSNVRES